MDEDEHLRMRCLYQRPFTKLFTFSAAPKKANFSPLASNVAITPPPSLPFPWHHQSSRTLMLPSANDPSPTALHGPRSTMVLVIAPFLTTRRTLRLILDTSMQILVNCGCRDLCQCCPHGSFVDHFLRRRLFGLSKKRGRERK